MESGIGSPAAVIESFPLKYPAYHAEKRNLILLKDQLAALETTGMQKHHDAAKRIRWIGTDVDFADLIFELRSKGYIEAASDNAALECAAPHFENVNQDARVLLQGKANQRNLGKEEGTFSCIPIAKKRKRGTPAKK
jgi:hypothetical protein